MIVVVIGDHWTTFWASDILRVTNMAKTVGVVVSNSAKVLGQQEISSNPVGPG